MRLPPPLILLATVLATSCVPASGPAVPGARDAPAPERLFTLDAAARAWVDSTLATLDVRAKAGQLVMGWMSGRYLPVESDAFEVIRSWVEDHGVGGMIISIGPPLTTADKLNRLQRLARVPLLIGVDLEHGPAQRLDAGVLLPWGVHLGGGTVFPPVMAIGATDDASLAYELGRVTALEGRAAGFHLNFAPVADVNNNPANPIINTRSYGQDPARVGAMVAAHVRGLQDHGMLATAKHFPGHGDVEEDSHLVPLTLRIDGARADSIELPPFRAAIDAGVAAVMTAHITVPALTGDSLLPATLSPRMLDSLLVRELGFRGMVVTDALDMGAIVARFGPAESAVLALEAGADMLLQPPDPVVAIDAVVEAVAEGRVTEARLDRSVRKVLESKARVGLHRQRTVPLEGVAERVGGRAHNELARTIAERAITLVRDRDGLVPLRPGPDRRVLSIVYTDDTDPFAGRQFNAALARALPGLPGLEIVTLGPGAHPAVLDSVETLARGADLVLFVLEVRVRSSKGSVAIEAPVADLVSRIAGARPAIAISFGNPYLLQQFPQVGTYLLGWGRDVHSHAAAARALAGEIPIAGVLPIAIPPLHHRGEGIRRTVAVGAPGRTGTPAAPETPGTAGPVGALGLDAALLDSVDHAIQDAIARGVTPGAALAVGRRDGVVRIRGFGATDWAPGAPAVSGSTVYDVASLTKVVGTTTAVMLLVERGAIDLDAPLARYLPLWPAGGWRDEVTPRRLLEHSGGLPPFVRFWHPDVGALRGSGEILAAIAALEPAYPPGTRTVYSDLGFMLLGATVETVSGRPLDAFLRDEVWARLGLERTGFNPVETGLAPMDRIAPTERDTVFRHAHVHGIVHDENAYAMGGVAGHAGLFSSAADLARFATLLLGDGAIGQVRLLPSGTVARFAGSRSPGARGLGWDRPPAAGGIARAFSAAAFGHTGFTGTSLWIDPELDLFVVLLTNRVNPTRETTGIVDLRRAVHDLIARAAVRREPTPPPAPPARAPAGRERGPE